MSSRSVISNSLWPHGLQHSRLLCPSVSWTLLKLTSIESVMPSSHLVLCHCLFLLPSVFPRIRVFSSESTLHMRRQKCWSFSFSISPSNEYSGLTSFRIDWFDLPNYMEFSKSKVLFLIWKKYKISVTVNRLFFPRRRFLLKSFLSLVDLFLKEKGKEDISLCTNSVNCSPIHVWLWLPEPPALSRDGSACIMNLRLTSSWQENYSVEAKCF